MARRLGQEGTVTLQVTVGKKGEALQVKVIQSSGYSSLDDAAAQAISQWRFIPATENGEPVVQALQTQWTYRLTDSH